MKPPRELLEAFKAVANSSHESVVALLIEDGFDAELMRCLAAWPKIDHAWSKPERAQPDAGAPTAAAWRWLLDGHTFDPIELAESAGVTVSVAIAKAAILIGNYLAFPDGELSKGARGALQAKAREALGLKRKSTDDKKSDAGGN